MITLSVLQGTSAWHAARAKCFTASEAPAMMGASKYQTRTALLAAKKSGISPDVSSEQQRLFDRGHAAEASARPIAEELIGDELYPATATDDTGRLLASFDGITLLGDAVFEHKLYSESLAAQVRAEDLEPHYYWQLEQQLLVSGAERALFVTSDGTRDKFESMYYLPVPGRADALLAGWTQFERDLDDYVPEPEKVVAVAAPVAGFGALSLRVEGRVLASNLDAFRADAETFIGRLPKPADLQTDQDFADADAAVKACAEAESRIKAAKDAALAQMTDVDTVLRTADIISDAIRAARLALDRAVKSEKENRKSSIVAAGIEAVCAHYATINATLGAHAIFAPQSLNMDIGGSIKGLRTLSSITDAVDTAVASAKIAASQRADQVRACRLVLADYVTHTALFPDAVALCASKAPDDLRNLAAARIADHEAREAARIEAERAAIRAEEERRAQREAGALAEKERARIRAEETARMEGERVERAEAARIERERQAASTTTELPKGDDARAAAEPAPQPATPATLKVGAAHTPTGATIRLGEINARIAPLSITADGLSQLGFEPIGTERSAKLYAERDFPCICRALIEALELAAMEKVA